MYRDVQGLHGTKRLDLKGCMDHEDAQGFHMILSGSRWVLRSRLFAQIHVYGDASKVVEKHGQQ